jgi:type I restriction enzyme S subunit
MAGKRKETHTGGREASTGFIPGDYSLAVGMPSDPPPEGWQWTQLTDLARLESGHTPSRRFPEYWDGDVCWIGIRDATANHGQTIYDTNQHASELGIENSSARMLPKNTVCLSRTASVGYIIVMGKEMATSQDFVNWVCSDELDHQFLKYILLSENRSFLRFASGTTHQTIYFPEVKAFHICHPPLPEQKAIAHILGSLDDKIELNRRMNETLEGMAQALFKSWFVDFDPVIDNALEAGNPIPEEFAARAQTRQKALADFPSIGNKSSNVRKLFPDSFQPSELGPIPTGWNLSTINEEYNVVMGQSPKGDTYNEEGEGTLFFQGRAEFGWRFPTPRLYTTDPKRMAKAGDALMSVRAPVGDFNMAINDCCVGRGLCALRHKAGGPSFTYYQMKDFQKHLDKFNGEGTVFGSINQKDLKGLKCLAPVGDTLDAFVEIVESMDSKILGNSNQILVLTNLRDTLLPKLISGDLRIEDAEKMVGAI